jgi:hypothetical protein
MVKLRTLARPDPGTGPLRFKKMYFDFFANSLPLPPNLMNLTRIDWFIHGLAFNTGGEPKI